MGIVVGLFALVAMLFRAFIQFFVELFYFVVFLLTTIDLGYLIVFAIVLFIWKNLKEGE
jgi:hypothetical protein